MTKIGISVINYSPTGRAEDAYFQPEIKDIKPDNKVLKQLKYINCDRTNPEVIRENAEKIMSHWFLNMQSKIDFLEMFDREKFNLSSKVIECERYPNSKQVKTCKIEFSVEEIKVGSE